MDGCDRVWLSCKFFCCLCRRPVVSLDRVRHKRQTLQDMARPLKHWLYKHRSNPYPTKSEKMALANTSQMTLTQVSNWFANARRRLKNTVRDPELNWESRIKMYNSCVEGNQELLSIDSEDDDEDTCTKGMCKFFYVFGFITSSEAAFSRAVP